MKDGVEDRTGRGVMLSTEKSQQRLEAHKLTDRACESNASLSDLHEKVIIQVLDKGPPAMDFESHVSASLKQLCLII